MGDKTKILIVDDSKLMRKAVRAIFASRSDMEVVGEAVNGNEALQLIPQLSPDVIVLDVNMPVMDGITTLKHMMIQTPTPTVMLSTLTKDGAAITFDSLKYGAVDFLTKPSSLDGDLQEQTAEIADKIAIAAGVELEAMQYIRPGSKDSSVAGQQNLEIKNIVAIGAAEGGYSALLKLIPQLQPDVPAAFIVVLYSAGEHIDDFVRYLDHCSALAVKRATEEAPLESGVCYISSGEEYVTIREQNGNFLLHVSPAPFSTRRGSIDMLMLSTAEMAGKKAVGIVVSGRGADGAEGLCEITANGGTTIVQKPQSCLCREMAENALKRCEANIIVADTKIASAINLCCA
ncbi:MAG: response regulator [Desulfobulbaceae bacterium]|nr:response regulator [Desulfobulbaceae bacterium]